MKTRRSLRNVNTRTGGTASRQRRARSLGTPRARLARTLAVPALVFLSFGATSAGYANRAVPARQAACGAAKPGRMPWMYARPNHMPWMYAKPGRMPWMYAKPNHMPWMYGMKASPAARARACDNAARKATA